MSKIVSILTLFLFFHCQLIDADSGDEINSIENFIPGEEESLATVNHCVNVISGSFFQVDHDLVVDGPQPLNFIRCYDSGHFLRSVYGFGFGSQYPLTIGKFWKGGKYYHAAIETQEGSYFEFKGEHWPAQKKVRVFLDPKIFSLGLSNHSDAGIGAHTNPDNIHGTFTYVDKDKQKGTWEIRYPDGSCRDYAATLTTNADKAALLTRIQHPTGNQTRFNYRNSLISPLTLKSFEQMFHTNAAGRKLNSIDRIQIPGGYQLKGSNGRHVNYKLAMHRHTCRIPKQGKLEIDSPVLQEVSAPHLPTTKYACAQWGKKKGYYKIGRVEKPDGRILDIVYDDKGRVKELKAPLGNTPWLKTFYTFDYESKKGEAITTVANALGTKALYRITKHKRIKSIEILEDGCTYCSKEYFWDEGKGLLRGKAYRTWRDLVNKAVKYHYDIKGNVVKETLFGNFTGRGINSFSFDGTTISDNLESCSTYFTYSNDGFNLKLSELDDFGLQTLYRYRHGTNLLTKKLILHHDAIVERTFHTYDDNAVLIKTIKDNGISKDVNDLAGVTERFITTITPVNDHLPSIGKPAEIKESCYDPETGQERLLRCTKCSYSKHGFLTRKDIFDADMNHAFSEIIEYDERDLVVKTIDAMGQATLFDYDANHNKIYEEEVGSGKSTRYRYDCMNRLIEEKEQHADGSLRAAKHQYDLVGNRTATIDPFGNKTTYVYDFLNRLIETHYPPMKTAEGKTIIPKQSKKYDKNHRVVCETDERGFSTRTKYNAYDQPIAITYPDKSKETFVYFKNGRLKSKWNREEVRTDYEYDPQGRVVKESLYDKEGNCIEQTAKTYRGKRLIEETDFAGNITEYRYDAAGRKIAAIRHAPEGSRTTRYSY
ncbi:MAG: DUF6531 domain-containing protein, partial [Waddliaceae bacterium]